MRIQRSHFVFWIYGIKFTFTNQKPQKQREYRQQLSHFKGSDYSFYRKKMKVNPNFRTRDQKFSCSRSEVYRTQSPTLVMVPLGIVSKKAMTKTT